MTIRVFISSTFRDMHAERDYLSRLVFPELRSRCQKRGAEFIGLDLRWGVTEEEAQREGALKICMDEIERCRPFFVCLLGSRYGWVPPPEQVPPERFEDAVRGAPAIPITDWYALDETSVPPVYRLRRDRPVPEDVAETLARFWEDAGLPNAGESITAREIVRGVFEDGFPATHALFYLRKPGIEADPEFPPAFVPVFVEQDAKRRAKLENLETKIRECADRMVVRDYAVGFAGLQIDQGLLPAALSDEEREGLEDGVVTADELDRFSAPVREAILRRGTVVLGGLEALGDQILEDLWAAIEKELERPIEVLDGHQRERAYHERFVVDRTRLFLGRDEIVERVLDGLADPAGGNLMAVTGAPGSGKSALLAECVRRARERFQGALVIPHFIGASPGSAILTNTLRSICETLKRERSLTEEVPDDPQELIQKWPEFLEKAGAQRRVVLLLDALNQLDPLDHSHELGWIPYRIPQGVTLIVSTLPSDCLDRLRRRVSGEAVIDVPVLAARDRQALVQTHLGQRGKKLSPAQLERLLDTTKRPEAGLPLYLLVALEELSLFGSYEALDGRIDLLPPSVAELFDQVLTRLEHDHGRDMTASICRWIAVSRSGMLESEILDLLAGREQVFPRARWSRFYHALESHLRPVEEETGEGLLAFYHDQLRFAVYRRYLEMQSPGAQAIDALREVHAELARYFRSIAIERDEEFPQWRTNRPRGLSELPHHVFSAGGHAALRTLLTDLGFLKSKLNTFGVYTLIEDFIDTAGDEFQPPASGRVGAVDGGVARIRDALCGTAHLLKRDVTQLPGQLAARVSPQDGEWAARLLKQADRWSGGVWLKATRHHRLPPSMAAPLFTIQGDGSLVGAVTFTSPHGFIAAGGADGTIRIWDPRTGTSRQRLVGHGGAVHALLAIEMPCALISGAADGTVRLWDVQTSRELCRWNCRDFLGRLRSDFDVRAMALLPDQSGLVLGGGTTGAAYGAPLLHRPDCALRALRLPDLQFERRFEGPEELVQALLVDPKDGRVLCAPAGRRPTFGHLGGGQRPDCPVSIWNFTSGRMIGQTELTGHRGSVSCLARIQGGRMVSGASSDERVGVWRLDRLKSDAFLSGHLGGVTAVTAIPGRGNLAASGSTDSTVRLWDLDAQREVFQLVDAGHVASLAVAPEGDLLVSASADGTLKIWRI